MKLPRRRAYWVGRSKDGFHLTVFDLWLPYDAVDKFTEFVMTVLGHPCCGRGPFGRIPGVDYLTYHWINIPCPLWRHNIEVICIPLTAEQALILQPSLTESDGWLDDDEPELEMEP